MLTNFVPGLEPDTIDIANYFIIYISIKNNNIRVDDVIFFINYLALRANNCSSEDSINDFL